MDYNRQLNASGDNPKVHIALLMVPGKNHTMTGNYSKSPLLLNPGGPGGSGVLFAMGAGASIQSVINPDQDIIGFDPRGIGETTPLADCYTFPSDLQDGKPFEKDVNRGIFHRFTWMLSGVGIGLVNSSSDALAMIDARSRATAKLCQAKDEMDGQDSILRHVSTPAVARDMLSIIDAWDAWRDESRTTDIQLDAEMRGQESLESKSELDTKGKLVYWGFSYGTLLGATFASMFPDRVGRVILDGVVDADYYVSPVWAESLLDTDAVEASFFHFCYKAGPRCAIYREGDSKADIEARFRSTMQYLKENPIRGINPNTLTPSIITYDPIKFLIFGSLYFPVMLFPIVAMLLDLFHRRDEATLLSLFYLPSAIPSDLFCANPAIPFGYQTPDVQSAIMCSDKRYTVRPFS